MTTLREAAQQALEALEWCEPAGTVGRGGIEARKQAIAALRAALAQEQVEPVQEPVAWRLWDEDPQGGGDWRYYDAKDFREGIDPMKYLDGLVPLYIAPPQRKPLTEEEIFAIENDIPDDVVSDRHWTIWYTHAIERAHGIGEQS